MQRTEAERVIVMSSREYTRRLRQLHSTYQAAAPAKFQQQWQPLQLQSAQRPDAQDALRCYRVSKS
jgi:hypothetical protein